MGMQKAQRHRKRRERSPKQEYLNVRGELEYNGGGGSPYIGGGVQVRGARSGSGDADRTRFIESGQIRGKISKSPCGIFRELFPLMAKGAPAPQHITSVLFPRQRPWPDSARRVSACGSSISLFNFASGVPMVYNISRIESSPNSCIVLFNFPCIKLAGFNSFN
jgi:hypothetical protein